MLKKIFGLEPKAIFQELKRYISGNKKEVYLVLSLVLLASVLRFYNLRDSIVFLGDEGRDALAVKQIFIDLDPTLLGPTASVGGFYLGPVYYYLIGPFFLLFGMDPVGGAVFVALTGVMTVVMLYYFVKHLYGSASALMVSLLYTVSPGILRFSRSSWNPNPIPFFVLGSLISLYWGVKKSNLKLIGLSGVFLGIVIQLHYLGLIATGAIGITLLLVTSYRRWLKSVLSLIIGFLVGASMYLLFEIRHGFPNIRSVIEFVTREGGATGPKDNNLPKLFFEAVRFNFESVAGSWSLVWTQYLATGFLLMLGYAFIVQFKQKKPLELGSKIIIAYWLITTLGMMMYRGQWLYHYFAIQFVVPFLVWGYVSSKFSRLAKVISLILIGLISIYLLTLAPTWGKGSRLLDQTERVAKQVMEFSGGEPYNFALITDGNSDHAYRFFLEINGAKPTPLEERVESQLIIICEKYPESTCAPLGNPLWEVAGFGRAEIDQQIEVYPQITIYKMVHHPDSLEMIGKPAK